ncbi:uncharacterized protein LOC134529905 [Bacillus rossius redtenbacheri]|uniref:uncharacterized protein LOC134529905 n=1 Tax=Bacillus rossius redtenbacheri TaxID=93214 RepID=UPI002FDC98A1
MHFRALSACVVGLCLLLGSWTPCLGQDQRAGYEVEGAVRRIRDASFNREPSCEELRAMWIFSKRQSRATEITNDIPAYRDPFAYNVWEPYPRARSAGGLGQHVYGRIVHDAPWLLAHQGGARPRPFEHVGVLQPQPAPPRRRKLNYRFSGGNIPHLAPISGSFQQLKELIQSERARELQEQRTAEDAAARAAALQGLPVKTYYGHVSDGSDQQVSADVYPTTDKGLASKPGVITFPSLLLPSSANSKQHHGYLASPHIYQQRSYPQMLRGPYSIQSAMFRQ